MSLDALSDSLVSAIRNDIAQAASYLDQPECEIFKQDPFFTKLQSKV